ncbi:hypothetical protein OQA88_4477 [Cercophora sp. LCS_1]
MGDDQAEIGRGIRTEDVRYNEFMEGVVADLTMEFLKILPTLPPDDDEGIIEGDAANVRDKRESPEESRGSINMMFHRILQLLAMDYKSMVLCLRRDSGMGDDQAEDWKRHIGLVASSPCLPSAVLSGADFFAGCSIGARAVHRRLCR